MMRCSAEGAVGVMVAATAAVAALGCVLVHEGGCVIMTVTHRDGDGRRVRGGVARGH